MPWRPQLPHVHSSLQPSITRNEELAYEKATAGLDDATGKIFSVDDVDLPQGYYKSPYFWGSMSAIGLSISCGVAGFSFIAPLLSLVKPDIGPSESITWDALTYTLTVTALGSA